MQHHTHGVADPVTVGVHTAVRLGSLPAFPSQDWCDRAADALIALTHRDAGGGLAGDIAVAIVRSPDPESSAIVEILGSSDPALATVIEPVGPSGPLGWSPQSPAGARTESATGKSVFAVSTTPFHAAWTSSPRGRLWKSRAINDLIIGVEPITGTETDRFVVVEVGLSAEGENALGMNDARAQSARVLASVLPLLADRVARAFGPGEINASTWLTSREQEVLEHIVLGRTVREIAKRIGRSPHTVHDHVKSLHKKLNANTRGELVARALGHLNPPHTDARSTIGGGRTPRRGGAPDDASDGDGSSGLGPGDAATHIRSRRTPPLRRARA